ncbi:hypothetical protein LPJ68_001738, partial [Coemansia sp. RSA 1086]
EEHVHGENCCHDHDGDMVNLKEELPFDEADVTMHSADSGLALLKEHKDEVVAVLEKIAGNKIDTFKTYHFPGRHYVVAWLQNFGIFGIRISYPMLINDSDDEDDSDDEAAGSSASK